MGSIRLLVAVVLLALLGGLTYFANKRKDAEEAKGPADAAPKLLEIPEAQVQRVELRRREGEPVLLRRAGNAWVVGDLPAEAEASAGVASAFASLAAERVVEDKATDLAAYGLSQPTLRVVVTPKDGKPRTLLLGDDTPSGSAVYAALEGDPRVFTLPTHAKTSLDKTVADLRDKRLVTVDADKLSRIELAAKGQTVEFGKNGQGDWQIVRPQPYRADGSAVEELSRKLRDAKMDAASTPEELKAIAAGFGGATPVATARLTDAAGTQALDVRKGKDDVYYARSTAVEGVHKVPNELGEALAKPIDDYRNRKLFDFGFEDPTKVEIRAGDKSYAFQKAGERWMAGTAQMDTVGVQNIIDKLRDLSATGFATAGLATPTVELAVTSKDGKRVERVKASKSPAGYLAQRDGEPALYQIDAKPLEELLQAAGDVKRP